MSFDNRVAAVATPKSGRYETVDVRVDANHESAGADRTKSRMMRNVSVLVVIYLTDSYESRLVSL